MGVGLSICFARHGCVVHLIDHRQSNIENAETELSRILQFLDDVDHTRNIDSVLDRVAMTTNLEAGVSDTEFILETVTESLEIKHDVFTDLVQVAPETAVLASNTSSLSITELASCVPEHADRVIGCHWWYPPYLLDPVEIAGGEQTEQETVDRTKAVVEGVEHDPIIVDKEVPGFIWNRIQFAVLRECMHLADHGVASIDDINRAVRDGYARRTSVIGPFETVDIAGVELFQTIASSLYPQLCDADEPHSEFVRHIEEGRTGLDSGAGFFEYDRSPAAVRESRDRKLANLRSDHNSEST